MMKKTEFEELLLLYGPDPGKWPDLLRDEATALMHSNVSARELIDRATDLEDMLMRSVRVEPEGAALIGRVLTSVAERDGETSTVRPGLLSLLGGAAAVSFLTLGFIAGTFDLIWLDITGTADTALLFVGESQTLMDTL
mgnify:CR=1 FL=1